MGTKKGTGTTRRKRPPVKSGPTRLGTRKWFAPAAIKARRLKHATQVLSVFQRLYDRTKNPVFAAHAFTKAFKTGVPPPDWVMAYLSRAMVSIVERCRTQIPRKNDLPRALYRAMEFDRSKEVNPFAAIADSWHDVSIALEVWWAGERQRLRDGPGAKWIDGAVFDVARSHPTHCTYHPKCVTISESAVWRAWRLHRDAIIETAPPVNQ